MSRKIKVKEPAGSKDAPSGREEAPPAPGGWARENLEAIVVAVIMALVIRHFCVEAFKIPTSSMEPTLFGNHPTEGIRGDRILVNKFVYRFSEPERWDVIVFKYPLDKTKNFIKRLVGLPGDEIKILGGNLYVNREPPGAEARWEVARKPDRVQEAIWQPVYPDCPGETPGFWGPEEGAELRTVDGGYVLEPRKGGESWAAYRGELKARRDRRISFRDAPPMTEIRLALDAALDRGVMKVELSLKDGTLDFRVPVGEGEPASAWLGGTEVARGEFALRPGRATRLEFIHVDGTVVLRASGREVLRHDYDPWPRYSHLARPRLRVGMAGGGRLALSGITIERDIHYLEESRGILTEQGTLRIPADSFFVLGDNCTSSKDSRLWKTVRVPLKDGRIVEGEFSSGDSFIREERDGRMHILDINGVQWTLTRDDVADFDVREEFAPFVARENLIGQAFMVFWPLKRVHLIH